MRKRKKLVAVAAVLGTLVIAASAYALWTLTQSSNVFQGKAGSSATSPLVLSTPSSFATNCYPGTSCDLYATVSNPSAAAVTVTAYHASAANSWNSAGCSASPVTGWTGPAELTTTTTLTPAIVIAPGASNVVLDLPNALALASTADPACAGGTASFSAGATIVLTETIGS